MKKAIIRALSLLLVCILVFGIGIISHAEGNAIPGDVNGDGEVSILDALLITRAVVNSTALENSDVNGDGKTNLLDVVAIIKFIATGEAPEVGEEDKSSADIVVEDGVVKEAVSINGDNVSAAVPEGVVVEEGTTELTLSVTAMDDTNGNITTEEDEDAVSYDVHVDGVSEENTVAIIVDLGAILPAGQNMGTVVLYHVENGDTVKMTQVMSLAELDEHNEFYYYPATGNVYVAMATFSEVTAVANSVNPWKGEIDYSWYTENPEANEFFIANADQLAGFARLVGGMAKDDKGNHLYTDDDGHWCTFNGKTVTLTSDINLADTTDENGIVFYPIGYYNSTESFDKVSGGKVTSSVYSFEGTFDGAGHTIANFYQNTWEMFGDYNDGYSGTPNHYKDGMGLFGYVYGGTIKNLTVENFTSDGEFTPTGVIAAFACNSTFENIAIVDCNPRVYNTGNGGIVGIGGNDNDPESYKLTFNNITIDNTNKITALWGSWDVACGGLVGMYRGAGHAYMNDCHVAAQIDVYNDVCGNYQYYWYRYAGMLIGTNKNMKTVDGYTVPETDKYHATNCTVHFDTWNDYYYCELVANSIASYTHDHQFSRLEVIDGVEKIQDAEGNWSRTGNFIVLGKNGNNTCYHIVSKNGKLTEHKHENSGYEDVDVNGDGVKEHVLKENNQCVYLPFNQLFTGYGWGVKHVPIYDDPTQNPFKGVTIRGREYTDSIIKFTGEDKYYTDGMTVKASDLFNVKDNLKIALKADNVIVAVTPAANSNASAKVTKGDTWQDTTITFAGTGNLMIAIQDYYFCTPTIINVTVLDGENYHIDADGTSNIEWQKSGSKYELVCTGCNKVLKTSETPVVYLDHSGSDKDSYNYSLGVSKDYPVRTLAEASKRLATTGGTITLTSDITAASTGINNPKDKYDSGVVNKMTPWQERITISGDRDGDGDADCGFDIASHGSSIYFAGPTTLEKLTIDGRQSGLVNNSDGGEYNIAVFVADWNDFTFGTGIKAYSPFYFIVGNYLYRTNGVTDVTDERLYIEAYCDDYSYLTRDTTNLNYSADGNHYTCDLAVGNAQKKVNIVLNKIDSEITREIDGEPIVVEAYDRVYLGTRNRTYDDLTVKNVHVNVESNDASFNLVYAGTACGSYKYENGNKVSTTIHDEAGTQVFVVDSQMENCSLDIDFNGTKDANAYTRFFRVGNSNTGSNGKAYLDKLDLALNGTFYFKDSANENNKDAEFLTEKGVVIANVVDATVTVSGGADRTRTNGTIAYNEMGIYFRLNDSYKNSTGKDHENAVKYTYGTHSFEDGVKPAASVSATYSTKEITANSDCKFSNWVTDSDIHYVTRECSICHTVERKYNPAATHEHTNTYMTGSSPNFVLKCEDCGATVPMYKQPSVDASEGNKPIIYVDVKKSVNKNASDNNHGFDADNAVATLGAAVSRVKSTGGVIKLMSNIEINSNGMNHPIRNDNYKLPAWSREIIFSSYRVENGEPTTGFKINAHGAVINFSGPAKLKNILIDGRSQTPNETDNGYYNIPVFVANWYSFATSEGVVAYGKSFFVIGHFFHHMYKVSDYYGKVPYLENGSDSYVADLSKKVDANNNPITIIATFTPATSKSFTVTTADGKTVTQNAVTAYARVYLGGRNEVPTTGITAKNKDITYTVKNAKISFTSHGASFGTIYAGSTGDAIYNGTVLSDVTTRVSGCDVLLGLNNSTSGAKSTTQQIYVGSTNFASAAAMLDSLRLHIYSNAYVDGEILTRNVNDLEIIIDPSNTTRVKGAITLTVGSKYTPTSNFERLAITMGSNSCEKYPNFNSRYDDVSKLIYTTESGGYGTGNDKAAWDKFVSEFKTATAK